MANNFKVIQSMTEEMANTPYPTGDLRNEHYQEDEENKDQAVLDALSAHIKTQFELNRDDRTEIEYKMLHMLEAMANKYDSTTLAHIQQMGGSELFMPLTSQQVSGGVAWINSILENGWEIEPTPIPDIPESVKKEIMGSIEQTMRSPQTPKTPEGIPAGPTGQPMTTSQVDQIKSLETEDALEKIQGEAVKRADKMATLIEDQLVDSNWDRTLKEFVNDLAVFPSAFLKTVYKKRKKMVTTTDGQGNLTLEAQEELVAEDVRVSPLDIFPSPDQTTINNGSLIERMKLSRGSIYENIGLPGYREDHIRMVLQEYDKDGLSEWQTTVDNARRLAENHSFGFNGSDGSLTGLRFMGPVRVEEIQQWARGEEEGSYVEGFEWVGDLDQDSDVEIDAILIGNHIIKLIPNLHPLGHRKYYMSSYRKTPGSFWGTSVAMLVEPHQKLVNATCRALSNNMGIASGPMSYILIDRLPQGEELGAFHPWKQYQMTSDPTGANIPPIQFFQPNDNSQNLLAVYQHYMNEAYQATGIPRGAMEGATSRIGAGDHTASGIASEIENASKAIRLAVMNIEKDVVEERIRDQYYTNMIHHKDDSVKGDFNIKAIGASSSIAKAVDNQQSIELLNSLGGGPGAELVGIEGFAAILSRIAKNNDMPNLIPSKQEIKERQKQQAEQPPQDTPEETKLKIEKIRAETRIKDQQLEDKNAAAERETRMAIAQMELKGKEFDRETQLIIQQMNQEQQMKVTALQGMNANARAKDANQTQIIKEQMKKDG